MIETCRDVEIRFSPRLKRALGRWYPGTAKISLHHALQSADRALLAEVVGHELAHLVARARFGRVRPHGAEWRTLMTQAGLDPRTSMPLPATAVQRPAPRKATTSYHHRCPVCQSQRTARRPVSRWRCAECVAAGLSGELVVTRRVWRG
ncbi:MAG: SprT-like domain-containing protein [Gemmatimonadetes bacterium]|nr:SprT-like domain-containing protein [Gemmatimonadota bacterium]